MKDSFAEGVGFIRSSFESAEGYEEIEKAYPTPSNRIFYLAAPPDAYEMIVERIGAAGLADQSHGFSRIIVEKPLGRDLASARALNERISHTFPEDQIYRIDHYLGKETVQNIMLMRFGNGIFEPVWNKRYVDHVQITMAETIGVGTRGRYYESAGALRDMMQNHMLQLLSLVAMEPPVDLDPDSIHDEKVKVLKSIAPITGGLVRTETVGASMSGASWTARRRGPTGKKRALTRIRTRRHSPPCASPSSPGGGQACRFSFGRARCCRGAPRRSPSISSSPRCSCSRTGTLPARRRTC